MAKLEVIKNNKVWDIESIQDLLNKNNKAVERAITLIYSYQTLAEQEYGTTTSKNGVGFNMLDAEILTSFAIQIEHGKTLTIKQLEIARRKIKKYSRQILRIMANQQ